MYKYFIFSTKKKKLLIRSVDIQKLNKINDNNFFNLSQVERRYWISQMLNCSPSIRSCYDMSSSATVTAAASMWQVLGENDASSSSHPSVERSSHDTPCCSAPVEVLGNTAISFLKFQY